MQHDGTQEECSDEEHEKSVVQHMSQNSDIKAEREVYKEKWQDRRL